MRPPDSRTVSSRPAGRMLVDASACIAGLVLLGSLLGTGGVAAPRQTGGSGTGGSLWISDSSLDNGHRLLVIVDQELRTAAVYHVDGGSGSLALKSSRDISWDLMVGDFNALPPKPADLKRMFDASQPQPPR